MLLYTLFKKIILKDTVIFLAFITPGYSWVLSENFSSFGSAVLLAIANIQI